MSAGRAHHGQSRAAAARGNPQSNYDIMPHGTLHLGDSAKFWKISSQELRRGGRRGEQHIAHLKSNAGKRVSDSAADEPVPFPPTNYCGGKGSEGRREGANVSDRRGGDGTVVVHRGRAAH